MGNGWRSARRGRLRRGWAGWLVAAVLVAGQAVAGEAPAPADRHAVVVNDGLVGSAFLIEEGVAVTNRHVVRGLGIGGEVELLASGEGGARVLGRLVALSPRMDLALLRVPAGFVPPVEIAEAPTVAGMAVTATGIDAGEGGSGARRTLAGVVLEPSEDLPAFGPGLVVWLPGARPGFSGGPLLDTGGRLVGMVTALRPVGGRSPVALAGGGRGQPQVEAFALRGEAVRAEARRLLDAGG